VGKELEGDGVKSGESEKSYEKVKEKECPIPDQRLILKLP
jgi:hypothetical protein